MLVQPGTCDRKSSGECLGDGQPHSPQLSVTPGTVLPTNLPPRLSRSCRPECWLSCALRHAGEITSVEISDGISVAVRRTVSTKVKPGPFVVHKLVYALSTSAYNPHHVFTGGKSSATSSNLLLPVMRRALARHRDDQIRGKGSRLTRKTERTSYNCGASHPNLVLR